MKLLVGFVAACGAGQPPTSSTPAPASSLPAGPVSFVLELADTKLALRPEPYVCDGEVTGTITVAVVGTSSTIPLQVGATTYEEHCIAGLPYDRQGHGGGSSCTRSPLGSVMVGELPPVAGELAVTAQLALTCGKTRLAVAARPLRVASNGHVMIALAPGDPDPFRASPPASPQPTVPTPPASPPTPTSPPQPEVPRPATGIYGSIGVRHSAIQHSPVANHAVTIRGARGTKVVRTDAQGRYLAELSPGDYTVQIAKPGGYSNLEGDTRARVRVVAGTATELHFGFSDGTRCLDATTPIATPNGPRPVAALALGDEIWVCGDDGHPRRDRVIATAQSSAPGQARRLALADGRVLVLAPQHPLADGQLPAELTPGMRLDGIAITAISLATYSTGMSHDLATASGLPYYAAGLALQSTLAPRPALACQPLTAPAVSPPTR